MELIKNNLANILTCARMALLPFMIALFYAEASWGGFAALLCFILYAVSAITDYFDGYVARKYNQITPLGTFLDPISDKVFVTSLLLLLVAFGRVEGLWILLVLLIFAREFLVSGLREFLGPKNIKMPVSFMAKWKTTAQMVATGFLILGPHAPYATEIGLIALCAATLLTVITGGQYFMKALPVLLAKDEPSEEP
ncbi:MAG: CDP-diacylglycerol--glycerol-3-phosphate 3-phosphatidyltransferase [Alphaproteobacteria bacterium]|nr:CDP-diacylglycerol--glycerol-3-phosphate 3-phosphatidyltransferase [Alphaproteobacteria bacterium]